MTVSSNKTATRDIWPRSDTFPAGPVANSLIEFVILSGFFGVFMIVVATALGMSASSPAMSAPEGYRGSSLSAPVPPAQDFPIVMGKDQGFSISAEAAARIEGNPKVFSSGGSVLPLKASFVDTRLLLAIHPASPFLAAQLSLLSSADPPKKYARVVRTKSGFGLGSPDTPFSRKAIEAETEKLASSIREDIVSALKSYARTAGVNVVFDFSRWRPGKDSEDTMNGVHSGSQPLPGGRGESPHRAFIPEFGKSFSPERSGKEAGKPGYGIADFKATINPGAAGTGHFEDLLREGSEADRIFQAALGTIGLFTEPFRSRLFSGLAVPGQAALQNEDEPCTRKVADLMLKNLGVPRDIAERALKFIDENAM